MLLQMNTSQLNKPHKLRLLLLNNILLNKADKMKKTHPKMVNKSLQDKPYMKKLLHSNISQLNSFHIKLPLHSKNIDLLGNLNSLKRMSLLEMANKCLQDTVHMRQFLRLTKSLLDIGCIFLIRNQNKSLLDKSCKIQLQPLNKFLLDKLSKNLSLR